MGIVGNAAERPRNRLSISSRIYARVNFFNKYFQRYADFLYAIHLSL